MADHAHDETDALDVDAGDFWLQIESSQGDGPIVERHLNLSTSGNVANGTMRRPYSLRISATMHGCSTTTSVAIRTADWWAYTGSCLGMLETALDQTAHFLEGCDEEPESAEEADEAE